MLRKMEGLSRPEFKGCFVRVAMRIWFFVGVLASFAWAEESLDKGFEWTGNLDFYYQHSPQAHKASDTAPGPHVLEGRYFDRQVQHLNLNFAELSLKKKTGRATFRIDLASGEMVDQMSGGSSQSTPNPAANEPTHNVTQAFVTYQATDRFSMMAGKFYTHIGFEVTRAKDNWQYSRSLLFNYGPFWQQGVGFTYALAPEKLTGTLYVINGWDGRTSQEGNRELSLGASLNYVGIQDLTLNYNYIGGRESPVAARPRRQLHEVNALYKISDRYQTALDVHHGTQSHVPGENQVSWWGAAVYFKAQVTETYSISPRYEYFDDSDAGLVLVGGFAGATDVRQRVQAFHLTNS